MLVLTRKTDESLVMGSGDQPLGTMKVTVLSVVGNRVKLGIEAPADFSVYRMEVWQRIQEEVLPSRTST